MPNTAFSWWIYKVSREPSSIPEAAAAAAAPVLVLVLSSVLHPGPSRVFFVMARNTAMLLSAALLFLVLASFCSTGSAQCTNFMSLSSCLGAVTGSGTPSAQCCQDVMQYRSNPGCLCTMLAAAKQNNIPVNYPSALAIPKNCNYGSYVPRNYKCNGYTVPTTIEN